MPEGFKIGDGHIEIHAEADRGSGRRAGLIVANEAEEVGRRRKRNFFLALFRPSPAIATALRTGVPSVLATPMTVAALTLGAGFAASFVSAVVANLALAGLGGAFAALGAFALRENERIARAFERTSNLVGRRLAMAAEPMVPAFVNALNIIVRVFRTDIAPLLERIFTGLAPIIEPLTRAVGDAIVTFLTAIADPKVLNPIRNLIIAMGPQIVRISESLARFFEILASNAPMLVRAFSIVVSILDTLLRALANVLVFFSNVLIIMAQRWNQAWAGAKKAFDIFLRGATAVITSLRNFFNSATSNMRQTVARMALAIAAPFRRGVEIASSVIQSLGNFVRGTISSIGSILRRIVAFIRDPFNTGSSRAVSLMRSLPGKILRAVGNLGSLLLNAGRSVIQGLINGITSKLGALSSIASKAAGVIGGLFPGSPVREGPLRVLNQRSTNPGTKVAESIQEAFAKQMARFPTTALSPLTVTPNVMVSPSIANPPVRIQVFLDGREIEPRMNAVIDERNTRLRSAVMSGGSIVP